MYFIGVDHHKQASVMTVLDEGGLEVKTGGMPNLRAKVEGFLSGLRPFTAVVEAGRGKDLAQAPDEGALRARRKTGQRHGPILLILAACNQELVRYFSAVSSPSGAPQ